MGSLHRRGDDRRARGERGFTLLELLMTLGVTTVGLVGLLSLHLSIVRGNDGASRAAEATQIAHATLESLRAVRRQADLMDLLTGNPNKTLPVDVAWCRRDNGVFQSTTVGRNGMTYRCRVIAVPLPAASSSLYRIRVEIGWTDDGAAQGAQGGVLDHLIAVEVIRTIEEAM